MDVRGHVLVNLIALRGMPVVPRQNETVMLPGEDGKGSGSYTVTDVLYEYNATPGEPPELVSVLVSVIRKVLPQETMPSWPGWDTSR